MRLVFEVILAFVALYPVCTAALWVAGGVLFRLTDEPEEAQEPPGGWPGVTMLIPAYNEEKVIGVCVAAALAVDYPELEVVVLDDGSADETERVALEAAAGDPRLRVLRDPVNRGKAEQLNHGFRVAAHELVVVTDADTHIHPDALKLLAARICRTPILAAVAGAPHVTNRGRLILALQILEASAIIGLIRRTQALTGRVGVVAGVLGIFRRERVLAVGGFDSRMATEDIDLTWRLLLAGWQTSYEPRALVGMQVPTTVHALWMQRKRWARGLGEVLHEHFGDASAWRHRDMWLLSIESVASLVWIVTLALSLVVSALGLAFGQGTLFGLSIAWGIAIAVVSTVQLLVALAIDNRYDETNFRAFLAGAIYPVAYWLIAATAALQSQSVALVRGPRAQRVVWDIPREAIGSDR
jgi:poly-beta-1,6-N-acetyl-D-glucosamine synthase